MSSVVARAVTSATLKRKPLKVTLLDLPDDAWRKILSYLSGSEGYDIQLALSLSMLSPRFRDLFALFASSITEITHWFFTRFEEIDIEHPMSADNFDFLSLFKHTTSLKKVDFSYAIPWVIDDIVVDALVYSAINSLEHVMLSSCAIDDETMELFLKCPSLHTLSCLEITELTGSAFARDKVRAPLRELDISMCPDFTREGLRMIFDSSSIDDLTLDYMEGETISLRDFIAHDLRGSKLAQRLQRISLKFSDVGAEEVFTVIQSIPTLLIVALHNPESGDTYAEGPLDEPNESRRRQSSAKDDKFIDPDSLHSIELLFPNVTIYLNDILA